MFAAITDVLKNVLGSEWFLQLIVFVLGVIWALPRVQQWRESIAQSRWDRLFSLAQEAASVAYVQYTEALKQGQPGAQLTREQCAAARAKAVAALMKLAKERGPGLLEYYGEVALEALVHRAYESLKLEGQVEG